MMLSLATLEKEVCFYWFMGSYSTPLRLSFLIYKKKTKLGDATLSRGKKKGFWSYAGKQSQFLAQRDLKQVIQPL